MCNYDSMIEELKAFSSADVQDMDRLMRELSVTSSCDERKLEESVEEENCQLYIVCEKGRIGCACLCMAHSQEFTVGFVESVTVLSSCRGMGYGRQLMEHLMGEAKRLGVERLHLTSSPRRVAANGLYQSLGFVRYETNCYVWEVMTEIL